MPAHHAVLFDLDGTLLNSLTDLAQAMNLTLARLGFPPHREEAYKHFVGDGMKTLARRVLPATHRDAATVQACQEGMRAEYGRRWAETTRPYPGIPELLDALHQRAVTMVILSNKPDDLTRQTVAHLLARWRFAAVAGARPDMAKKPDPAGALRIADLLGRSPADFLYLGDSSTDMRTARAAGMKAIGAGWGFRTVAELQENGAEAIINQPLELLQFLEKQADGPIGGRKD